MRTQLDGLERHGELVDGIDRFSREVRAGRVAVEEFGATDRYLAPAKATDQIIRGARMGA
jgi:hypothetical protein